MILEALSLCDFLPFLCRGGGGGGSGGGTPVPEIDGSAGIAALSLVACVAAFMYHRMKR